MIVIIDYGMGNIGSIANMLKKIGVEAEISSKISEIKAAHKLILPGVGAFDNGVENLRSHDLIGVLNDKVLNKRTPILGICLGMQLFTKSSEEGSLQGLGWIDARTVKFNFTENASDLKIPHMGWNDIVMKKNDELFENAPANPRFYFVHSYHVVCNQTEDVLTTTNYGYEFASSFKNGNIYGVQFHPEKSHKYGMGLLKNFAEGT